MEILNGSGLTKYKKTSGAGSSELDAFIDHAIVEGSNGNTVEPTDTGGVEATVVGAEGFPIQVSAFGELLVAEEHTDIAVRFGANMGGFSTKGRISEGATGVFSYSANGYATIDSSGPVDASLTSVALCQYRIGRPQIYRQTTAVTNASGTVEVGPHDDEEGFYLVIDAATGGITKAVIRKNSTDSDTLAASFDGDDLSSYDFRDGSIFIFKYGWLGYYPPTIWVIKDQSLKKIHTFPTDSGLTEPHLSHPALPCRVTAKGGAICRTSSWVGGSIGGEDDSVSYNPVSYSRTGTANTAAITVANFRVKALDANSRLVRIRAILRSISPFIQANATGQSGAVRLVLYAGVTLGGTPSWAAARADSLVEVDTAGTFVSGTDVMGRSFGYSDTNQGGANFSTGEINPSKIGAIGWAGDMFSIRLEPLFGGTDSWDYSMDVEWTE